LKKGSSEEKNKLRLDIENKIGAIQVEIEVYFDGVIDWCKGKIAKF
jgi:hypothetical protein